VDIDKKDHLEPWEYDPNEDSIINIQASFSMGYKDGSSGNPPRECEAISEMDFDCRRYLKGYQKGKKDFEEKQREDEIMDRWKPPHTRINFDDPAVQNWLQAVISKHPEIIFPAKKKTLLKILGEEFGNTAQEMNALTNDMALMPGKPLLTGKNLKKHEWEACFAYYCLMQYAGFTITPENIASMTDRSINTVKAAFKKVQQDISNFNP
jgi:hypothetical protein